MNETTPAHSNSQKKHIKNPQYSNEYCGFYISYFYQKSFEVTLLIHKKQIATRFYQNARKDVSNKSNKSKSKARLKAKRSNIQQQSDLTSN